MADKELTLGTLFTGKIDKSIGSAIKQLETLVKSLNNTLAKISKAGGVKALTDLAKQANKTGSAVNNSVESLSAYAKAMVKAETHGKRFTTTLSELSKFYKDNSLKIKDTEQAMYKADGVLRQLNREVGMNASSVALSNNNWKYARDRYVDFNKAANLTTITQKVLNGEIKATRAGITDYIKQVTNGSVVFDKFTASTKKSWPIINQINKAIDSGRLSWQEAAKMQASYQAITSKTASAQNKLTQETTKFTEASKRAVPMATQMNKAIDNGTMSWQEAAKTQATYRSALNGTLPSQKAAAAAIEATKKSTNAFTEASKKAVPNATAMNKAIDAGTMSWQEASRVQATYRSALDKTLPSQRASAAAIDANRNASEKFTKASKSATPNINEMNKAIDAGTMSWQSAARWQSEYRMSTTKTGQAISAAKAHLETYIAAKKELTTQLKNGNISLTEGAKRLQTITKNYNDAVPASQRLATATGNISKPMTFLGKQIGSVNGAVDRLKAAFKVTAAYGAASTAIYAVVTAMKSGVSAIVDYDQSLKNLQAITTATDSEVSVMGETIKNVARTTKFSASEVADGMVLLGQAGFSAGESINAMQATANLATGTLTDMKTTTDLLTTVIRAFNLDTIESGRVSDVMANAVNKSKLTIDKLRTAFNYVGATAAQAGMSLEETAASAMVLANNGLRASTIGTGLRQVLARLLSPNAKLREAYEAHGIALDSVNPRVVGYQNALMKLSTVLYDSSTQTINSSKAFELFGLRGAQAATILTKEFISGNFNTALDNVFKVGTAADMAGLQIQGLGLMFKNLVDRAKNVAIALGEGSGFTGAMKAAVSTLQSLMGTMESFVGSTLGGAIIQFGLLTAGIAALRGAIVFLTSAIAGLSIVQTVTTNFRMLTLAMELQGATMIGLAGTLNKLKAAFIVLWTIVKAHPFAAITAVIAAVVVTINSFTGASEKLAKNLAEQAVQLRSASNVMALYSAAVSKSERGSTEYASILQRLQGEHPKLVVEILKMNNALDLADIATSDLVDSMRKLAESKAYESIKSSEKALRLLIPAMEEDVKYLEWMIKLEENSAISSDTLDKAKQRLVDTENKLTAAKREHAQGIKDLVDMGSISKAQAYEMVDAMNLEAEESAKLKQAFEKHFIAIADGSSNAVAKFQDVFGELPPYFSQLYSELDALRQADFAKAVDSMNREVAAHKKRSQDMGIDQYELEAQIDAIRKKAYDDFVAGLDKETNANEKSLEKRQEAYERLANKVKSVEEQLLEDLKSIRQQNMTDEQKYYDDRKEARAALAMAIKASAEAETQAEIKAAAEMLKDASAKYRELAEEAKTTFKSNSYEAEKAEKEIIKGFDGIVTSFTDLKSKMEDPAVVKADTTQAEGAIKNLGETTKATKEETDRLAESTDEAAKGLDKEKEAADRLKDALDETKKATDGVAEATDGLAASTNKANAIIDGFLETWKKSITISTNSEWAMKRLRGEIDAYGNEAKEATETTKESTTSMVGYSVSVRQSSESIKSLTYDISEFIAAAKYAKEQKILQWYEDYYSHSRNENPYRSPDPVDKPLPPELRSRGGKIPGHGGGDTVPAMLEKGEFVIRKEAVQKYGSNLFNNLNSMVAGMKIGGLVPKVQMPKFSDGGSVGASGLAISNQLHTINLNINSKAHTLYGDEQAVRGLVKTLRREQLVTA